MKFGGTILNKQLLKQLEFRQKWGRKSVDICEFCEHLHREDCTSVTALTCTVKYNDILKVKLTWYSLRSTSRGKRLLSYVCEMNWEGIATMPEVCTCVCMYICIYMSRKIFTIWTLQFYNVNIIVFLSVNPNPIEHITVTTQLVSITLMPQPLITQRQSVQILNVTLWFVSVSNELARICFKFFNFIKTTWLMLMYSRHS
jgi:hypothetical protein